MSSVRLRLAVRVGSEAGAPTLPALAALARAAEEAGAQAVFVPDTPDAVLSSAGAVEAYTALGALAVRTRAVALGALASALPGRPPSIVAKQATTLDHLSGGRALLGLRVAGGGLGDRRRLVEAIGVCRALFGGEEAVHTTGRHYRLEGAVNRPGPVQPGGPPVVVEVGRRHRLLLGAALRRADVVVLGGPPVDAARRRRRLGRPGGRLRHREGAPAVLALVPVPGPTAGLASGEPPAAGDVTAAVAAALGAGADGVVLDVPAGVSAPALASAVRGAAAALG